MSTASVEGEGLARVAFNALAFIPARARDQFIRVSLSASSIEFAGSDGYAAGKDNAPVHNGPGAAISFAIERDALVEIEAYARANKKSPIGLSCYGGALHLSGPIEPYTCAVSAPHVEAWTLLDAIFQATELQSQPWFGAAAFDPALLARFSKVKAANERVADFLFVGPEKPVLVKVGGTFRGLVMPVYREPAEAYSPDGLW